MSSVIEAPAVVAELRELADKCRKEITGYTGRMEAHDAWYATLADGLRHGAGVIEQLMPLRERINEVLELLDGQEDYADDTGPNLAMQVAIILKGRQA